MTNSINTSTQLCAVIGNPVAHSLSPAMHNAAFAAAGLNYVYLAFAVGDLAGCMAGMRAMDGFRGLSVTIPHKVAVMEHLDAIDALAKRVGCVNTVVNEKGRLLGTITDGLGTLRAFEQASVSLENKRVLFVGTGGAARAVAFAMLDACRPQTVRILGRTPARMQRLVADLGAFSEIPITGGSLARDLAQAVAESDVIIQATPLGMHGHAEGECPVPRELLRPEHIIFDMVYRPMKTQLIRYAEEVGCVSILGLEMLLNQAVLQFDLWTGAPAPVQVMRQTLIEALQENP
ncbi:MAG TPA: shikimate dehydrogenase [Candidatus Hydrogenedentes bacterium]|nr:shikimate dehydrogenase [Candidatus Hydrogenedentota bacterium]